MGDNMYSTEAEVKTILHDIAEKHDEGSSIFVAKRETYKNNPLKRTVTFVIQTKEGNEALINEILKYIVDNDTSIEFLLSDINVQGGNFTVDYLFVSAEIAPKLA